MPRSAAVRRAVLTASFIVAATGLGTLDGGAGGARHSSSPTTTTTLPSTPGAATCAYPVTPTTPTTTTTTTTTIPKTTTTQPAAPTAERSAYYLVKSNGGVRPYGGARFRGSEAARHLHVRFVGGAVTADGGGYWLATTRANVYPFGDAHFLGSPVHLRRRKPIVAIASAPFGEGYWLAATNGAVYNYGTAPFCGSLVHTRLASPIVAFAPTPDDAGYWLVAADGTVYDYGNAPNLGSPLAARLNGRVTGIASTADGRGYWITTSSGVVYRFGDAPRFGFRTVPAKSRPVVSIVPTADGGGYWLATAKGRVFNHGDARFAGSLARTPPPRGVTITALMRTFVVVRPVLVTLPHGAFGYDISNFQCSSPGSRQAMVGLPSRSAVSVIQVAGWLDGADNSCLAAEAAWAKRAAGSSGASYSLYLFVNSPDTSARAGTMEASGPRGTCATITAKARALCAAYNYGFNGANQALAYATDEHVHARLWWLDIENDSLSPTDHSDFAAGYYWSRSRALNDATIEGALDALHRASVEVGLYSTSVQFPVIAGNFVPGWPHLPLWVAGVPRTNPPYSERGLPSPSVLGPWCQGTASYGNLGGSGNDLFARGVPLMLQETPGTLASPYGIDPDYAC